jgi:hypothetical protein
MKKKITLALVAIVAVCAMSFNVFYPNGEAGKTGAYSEGDCTQCHADFAVNTGTGSIVITSVPSLAGGYYPDSVYTVTVTVSQVGDSLFGFDFEALTNATTNGGTLSLLTPSTDVKTKASSTRLDVLQTGTGNISLNSHAFSFKWTAPATGSGTVTFYASGLAADNDGGTSGDYCYTTSMVLTQNTVGIAETVAKDYNLSVFPNPSSDNLNVKFSLKGISSVNMDIIDITGSKVADLISENGMNGEVNKTFNISSYAKGIYFVRLKINNETIMQKIVVQ